MDSMDSMESMDSMVGQLANSNRSISRLCFMKQADADVELADEVDEVDIDDSNEVDNDGIDGVDEQGPWSVHGPWCMVGSWSMFHVLSMVQDEDATMWRLNGNFRRGWSIVHGPSNGAWSIHGPK